MATFPGGIKSFTNPIANDHMNILSHAQQHTDANDEITAIQTALGTSLGNVVVNPGVAAGGTGSAGAGKQYVVIEVAGIKYKVLHDGTI
jgi:hypothetical protein